MKNIAIEHFQGIEKAEIDLSPGINVFLGPSDVGKSSIIRALRGWSFNEIGEGFVQAGAKYLSVDVDGIRWEKSDKINRYIVGKNVYDKVGRGNVPEQIREMTKVREVEFGDGVTARLNIAEQFGSEFMVGFKGSDNAKIVGSLSGIHQVFNALRDATADHSRARGESKRLEKEVEEAEGMVERHAWIEEIVKRMATLGSLIAGVKEKDERLEQLRGYVLDLASSTARLLTFDARLKALEPVVDISFDLYDRARERADELTGLAAEYQAAKSALDSAENRAQELAGVGVVDFGALDTLRDRANLMEGLQSEFEVSKKVHVDACAAAEEAKGKLQAAEQALEEAVDGIDLCPVTNRPMPDECKAVLK